MIYLWKTMMFHWYVSLLQGIIHSFGPCKYILKRMKSYAAIYYKRSICSTINYTVELVYGKPCASFSILSIR